MAFQFKLVRDSSICIFATFHTRMVEAMKPTQYTHICTKPAQQIIKQKLSGH